MIAAVRLAGTVPMPDLNRLYAECDWDPDLQRMVLRDRQAPTAEERP